MSTSTAAQDHQQQQEPPKEAPWWAAFPAPQSTCTQVPSDEMKELIQYSQANPAAPRDWLLVDVRRTDYEGGTVATSINFPAHTLYQTRDVIYRLCRQAGVKRVLFYCGASNGRGPRCAGWMQDYIKEVGGEDGMEAQILKGGIKGWVKSYGGELMEYYEPTYWEQFK